MSIDLKEPFRECPKCGFNPGIESISKPIAMYHYYCPSCGHEEQGLQHIIDPELMKYRKDVVLSINWESDLVSTKELLALKKIDERFKGKRPQEVKRMVGIRPNWIIGPLPGGTGYDLYDKAKELGLNVEIRDVE